MTGAVSVSTLWWAAGVAAAVCVPLSLLSGRLPALVHLAAVVAGWAYNVGLKSTVVSVLPYAVAFGALPAFVVLGGGRTPAWWLVAAGSLLGSAAHFANVIPDLRDDALTGVRGLPHRFGRTGSVLSAAVLLLAASVVLAIGPTGRIRPSGAAVLTVAVAALSYGTWRGRSVGSRAPFRSVLVVAVLDVGLFLLTGAGLS